jgi:uncharacterized protein (DUF58 family)
MNAPNPPVRARTGAHTPGLRRPPGRVAQLPKRLASHRVRVVELGKVAPRIVAPLAGVVTRLGWGMLLFGFGCWFLGWRGGWRELMVVATAAWLLLLASILLTIGRARLSVTLIADPQRVVVGAPAAGAVRVRNEGHRPLLPIGLELPIGLGAARFTMPILMPGVEHEELFVVPTQRRGVVVVGPAMTVRGDPIGLLRRAVSWTHSIEIFVHPITVRLDSLGTGFLRDLEGQTTNELSMSDLAFHALRDYQPGDDRRYIHWRSSAKTGRFMVRQFLDTRRSHVALIIDSDSANYTDPDEFELAISAAASIAVRTVSDDQEVTVLAGEHADPGGRGTRVLDTFSRAELGEHGLLDLARRTVRIAPDVSLVFLVTGPNASFEQLQRAANEFPVETRVLSLQVDPKRPTGRREFGGLTMLTLHRLGDLAALLGGVAT